MPTGLHRTLTMRTAGFITTIRSKKSQSDRRNRKKSSSRSATLRDSTTSAKRISANTTASGEIFLHHLKHPYPNFTGHFFNDDVLLGLVNISQAAREGRVEIFQNENRTIAELNSLDEDGLAPLHHAAHYDRTDVVEILIMRGANVNIRAEEDDSTPLHLAVKYRRVVTVKLLLKYSADTTARDRKGLTPLHMAARRGYEDIVRILLKRGRADSNALDADKLTPLHQAAIHGNVGVCRLLVDSGANIRAKEINDITPLMLAATGGHVNIMKLLIDTATIKRISLTDYIADADNEGNSTLHLAVANGSIEATELCLDHKAFVDIRKCNLFTPLHIAAVGGIVPMAKLLINRGSSINARDVEQMTPLHRAAMYGRVDMVNYLISRGASVDAKDADNFTPLICAAWKGQTLAATALIQHGAKISSVDTEMKSCLHWAVGCGHLEFTLTILLSGGDSLLDLKDKNDQTPMHYAAELGFHQIMKLFLDYGAKIDPKDRDEKTPLHLAAQYGRLQCVQILIEANSMQINEDDVEGRTPLLLASLEGHCRVVKCLLYLGAEITSRDDIHWSALALASSRGHLDTMVILIDNHAEIDAIDKNKNTPLHLSCANGHVEATELLLNKGADVSILNNAGQNCLDAAIENLQDGTSSAIINNKNWRMAFKHRDRKGYTPMRRLIEKLPKVALLAMDRCVHHSHIDHEDPNLRVTYNYEFLDPGPDDMLMGSNERYFALTTMVKHGREQLLSHELCQTLMALKWTSFVRYFFYTKFLIHVVFMVGLTSYAAISAPILTSNLDEYGCSVIGNISSMKRQHGVLLSCIEFAVIGFVLLNVLKATVDMYSQRLRYCTKFSNLIHWIMMFTSCAFVIPPFSAPCAVSWINGALGIFLAWIIFLLYLQRFDQIGIYVVMFVAVLSSLMKAIIVYAWFIVAFGSAFFIMLARLEQFNTLGGALIKTFVMTIGEFDYADIFHTDTSLEPFEASSRIVFVIFLFLMPIVLINLMIGISVGDIEGVQKGAFLRRLAMQVELITDIDRKMPLCFQRKVYAREVMVEPNKKNDTRINKVIRFFIGSSNDTEFVSISDKDRDKMRLEELKQEIIKQKLSQRQVCNILQQQTEMLRKISEKLDITIDAEELPMVQLPRPYSSVSANTYYG
ncbi:uncharacterized protein LOC102805597 [Saccoglossus kowalevskii]